MIIFALVIVTILFFVSCNLLIKKTGLHRLTTVISSLLLLITIIFSILNFHQHYGMHLANRSHTEKLASASPKQSLLIYENVGSAKKHSIVIYKHANNGKVLHTKPDVSVKNQWVKTNHAQPKLKVIHHRYVYNSRTARFWFHLAQKGQNKRTTNVFYVPKSWTVLSANQAKVLKATARHEAKFAKQKMNSPQAKMQLKQRAQAYVQGQMMKVMQKNPKLSLTKKAKLTKKFAKEFQMKTKQQAMQNLMKKALTKAKQTPAGYATK